MDLADYSCKRYKEIVEESLKLAINIGFKPEHLKFIPISGFNGENLTDHSPNMIWYKGPTL